MLIYACWFYANITNLTMSVIIVPAFGEFEKLKYKDMAHKYS